MSNTSRNFGMFNSTLFDFNAFCDVVTFSTKQGKPDEIFHNISTLCLKLGLKFWIVIGEKRLIFLLKKLIDTMLAFKKLCVEVISTYFNTNFNASGNADKFCTKKGKAVEIFGNRSSLFLKLWMEFWVVIGKKLLTFWLKKSIATFLSYKKLFIVVISIIF